jgi:type I restriction enzyme M protein
MSIDKTKFITPTQLAKMLGISRVAVHQKIQKKEIEVINIGDPSKPTYLIPKESLSAELQERIQVEQKKATESVVGKDAHHHDLNFEKELWAAADKLRGNIDVSEYKNIVLGLLFLKYISDAFYKRREELKALTLDSKNEDYYVENEQARAQILETKDFYKSAGVFYVPENSRWEYLQTKTMQSDIGQVLDKAMEHIEEDNRAELEGVLPKVYTRTTLDSSVLGELVNIFSRISFDHDFDREKDILGRIYEYFLGQFASSEGKRGGEFFTPRSIVKLLVEILEPYENARVLDPACGSGGMFVSMAEYLRNHKQDASKLAIGGQESNQNTLRLAKMNLAIRGLSGKIELGNTYYQDKFPHLKADFVIANPPFNAEWEPSKLSDNDPRITFGVPPSGSANFMWVQHFAHHLAPTGYAGFVMPNGALSASGKEKDLLQKLIESDMVDVVISCPSKLFYNVTLPVSLWFLAKNKGADRFRKRPGETLFIDARNVFEQISRKQVVFNAEQIKSIADTVRAWRGETAAMEYKDVIGFCKSVTQEKIRNKHFILTPDRYVGLRTAENDGVPFEDKLANLSLEIEVLLKTSNQLRDRISENIKKFSQHSKSSAKWQLVKLGDVADVQWGDTNTTKASYKSEGYLAFSAAGPDGYMDHYDFDRDGIVLSAIGANCGETWFAHGKWSCIKNTIRIWGKDGKADTRILYYVTHNKDLWPQRGSAQPFISQTDARNMEVLLPDFDEQKRLSDLLAPFDEEIESIQLEAKKLIALRESLVAHLLGKNLS